MSETEEIVWQGRFITAKKKGKWEYVSRSRNIRAAVILAIHEGQLILVEQFRVPLGRNCLELPAGLVGDDGADEPAEIAAVRELEEEAGFSPGRMEALGEYYSSPGMVTEGFSLFRAHDLTKTSDGGGVEGENITVHMVPLQNLSQFVATKRAEGCAIDVKMLLVLAQDLLG